MEIVRALRPNIDQTNVATPIRTIPTCRRMGGNETQIVDIHFGKRRVVLVMRPGRAGPGSIISTMQIPQ